MPDARPLPEPDRYAAYAEAMAEHVGLKARSKELGGLLRAAPLVAEHRRLGEQLSELGTLPLPPSHWASELPGLIDGDATLKTRLSGLDGQIQRLRDDAEQTLGALARERGLPAAAAEVIPGRFAARELQHVSERPETGLVVVGSTTRGSVGRLLIGSIFNRDVPVVEAAAFFIATAIALANLTVDVLQMLIDPRIRRA